jgi:hypothetical protein
LRSVSWELRAMSKKGRQLESQPFHPVPRVSSYCEIVMIKSEQTTETNEETWNFCNSWKVQTVALYYCYIISFNIYLTFEFCYFKSL